MIENRFVVRMLAIDPNYGSQAHQRTFVARLDRWQSLQPCLVDHEHEAGCYSEATQAQVRAELQPPTQHALSLPMMPVGAVAWATVTQIDMEHLW